MRVRALAKTLTSEQREVIGGFTAETHDRAPYTSGLEKGKEYVVIELVFTWNARHLGSTVWVGRLWDEYLVLDPIELFEVVDPRPSRYWEFSWGPDREARLQPRSLRENPHLLEDVSDDVPAAVEQWRQLRRMFELEDAERREE